MGAPAMNFLEGEIGERNGQPVIHLGVGGALTSLPLAERHREIAQQAGRRVVLGIRPETLVEASRARPEPSRPLATLDAVVEVVEPTGRKRWSSCGWAIATSSRASRRMQPRLPATELGWPST